MAKSAEDPIAALLASQRLVRQARLKAVRADLVRDTRAIELSLAGVRKRRLERQAQREAAVEDHTLAHEAEVLEDLMDAADIIQRRQRGPTGDTPQYTDQTAAHPRLDDPVFKAHWKVSPTRVPRSPSLQRLSRLRPGHKA